MEHTRQNQSKQAQGAIFDGLRTSDAPTHQVLLKVQQDQITQLRSDVSKLKREKLQLRRFMRKNNLQDYALQLVGTVGMIYLFIVIGQYILS